MKHFVFVFVASVCLGQTAGIRGVVNDEAGGVITGALVTATRQYTPGSSGAGTRFETVTRPDGTFEILGLAPGVYAICSAKPPTDGYVDFCAWTLRPPLVSLAAGVVTNGYRIRLEKGVRIDVAVQDPDGVLHGHSDERRRQQLRVTVGPSGLPANQLHFSHSDKAKAEYFVVAPKALRVKVRAEAGDADLSKATEPPGLAKKAVDEELVLSGVARRVEFRYHKKKD